MPSKLSIVKNALENNPNIRILEVRRGNYLSIIRSGPWSETYDLITVPEEPLYDINKLQELMLSLIPNGLEPTSITDFYKFGKHGIYFGKLYFDEHIGLEKTLTELAITDPDLLKDESLKLEFSYGKKLIKKERPLQRRTWVSLYPSAEIAKNLEYEYNTHIDGKTLKKLMKKG